MDPTDLSDDQLDQLAQQLAGRLPTGTHGDRIVLSRRQALAVASGTVSLGALLGLGSDSALAQASADTSVGAVGAAGDDVDVYLDQLRDPGGDEVLNVDDTGAINAQPREWVFGSVSTERIGSGRHYAGAFDGADADARLDNALLEASDGDVIYLEKGSYTTNRTISKRVTLIGVADAAGDGAEVSGDWVAEAAYVTFEDIRFTGSVDLTGVGNQIRGGYHSSATVTVDADTVSIRGAYSLSVTFNSGTSTGIVDSCRDVSVTDNGSNTIGDI